NLPPQPERSSAGRPSSLSGAALAPRRRTERTRMVPIVYSPAYNVSAFGLERLHPFDGQKYRRIHDWLIAQGLRKPGDFVAPGPCSRRDLLAVHTPAYLRSLWRPWV